MKITAVTPVSIGQFLFVEIETDAGITGLGESGTWGHLAASRAAIETFAGHLLGEDPGPIERHWNLMHRFSHFQGGAINGAIAAIDIALWDVKGKGAGGPGPLPPRRTVPDPCQGLRPRLRQDHRRAGGELRCPQGGRLQRGGPYQPLPRRARGRALLCLPCEPHEPRYRDRAPRARGAGRRGRHAAGAAPAAHARRGDRLHPAHRALSALLVRGPDPAGESGRHGRGGASGAYADRDRRALRLSPRLPRPLRT